MLNIHIHLFLDFVTCPSPLTASAHFHNVSGQRTKSRLITDRGRYVFDIQRKRIEQIFSWKTKIVAGVGNIFWPGVNWEWWSMTCFILEIALIFLVLSNNIWPNLMWTDNVSCAGPAKKYLGTIGSSPRRLRPPLVQRGNLLGVLVIKWGAEGGWKAEVDTRGEGGVWVWVCVYWQKWFSFQWL